MTPGSHTHNYGDLHVRRFVVPSSDHALQADRDSHAALFSQAARKWQIGMTSTSKVCSLVPSS